MRRIVALAACLVVVASGCGGERQRASAGGGTTVTVQVDARTNRFNASFLTYFPRRVTVRPGDAVQFRVAWSGEPHGVAFGTLVERALDAAESQGLAAPEVKAIPLGDLVWPGSLPPAAAQPCFLEAGVPPADGTSACPTVDKPPFNGRQAYHSSGFIPEDRRFTLDVAADAAPGEYRYFCPFHGPQMTGTLVVSTDGPTPRRAPSTTPPVSSCGSSWTGPCRTTTRRTRPTGARAPAASRSRPGQASSAGHPAWR